MILKYKSPVWAEWGKNFPPHKTPNIAISFGGMSSASGKGQVRDASTASHQTVHPTEAPWHFTIDACGTPHVTAHLPFKRHGCSFLKPDYAR